VEEDALDPAFGHRQQDGCKGLVVLEEDQRRLTFSGERTKAVT
jgi:hypothetical protein